MFVLRGVWGAHDGRYHHVGMGRPSSRGLPTWSTDGQPLGCIRILVDQHADGVQSIEKKMRVDLRN